MMRLLLEDRAWYVEVAETRDALVRAKRRDDGDFDGVFFDAFAQETAKVNQFARIKEYEIFSELQVCYKDIKNSLVEMTNAVQSLMHCKEAIEGDSMKCSAKDLAPDPSNKPMKEDTLEIAASRVAVWPDLRRTEKLLIKPEDVESRLTDLGDELVHLEHYVRSNFRALIQCAVVFDQVGGRSASNWCIAQTMKEPFANLDMDRLFIALSVAWEKHRAYLVERSKFKKIIFLIHGESPHQPIMKSQYKGEVEATAPKTESESESESESASTSVWTELMALIGSKDGGVWKPPESFERKTTKYWVRPESVAVVKAWIVRYVPFLLFGYNNRELAYLLDPLDADLLASAEKFGTSPPREAQMVTSIYLDNAQCDSYHQRINRFEGAQLVRCRWYGMNDGGPDVDIYVERKTHHESWSGLKSTKERFVLPQKRIKQYLDGQLDLEAWARHCENTLGWGPKKLDNFRRLATETNELVQSKKLKPMLRTSYLRSAFQASDNNEVRFSLDINLCMVDEFVQDDAFVHFSRPSQRRPWCRIGEEVLSRDEVVRFPYAVLEVKLQTSSPPAWVNQMLMESRSIWVYKLSKYIHGAAMLHRDRVIASGVPHWIPEFEAKGWLPGFSIPRQVSASNQHSPKQFGSLSLTDSEAQTEADSANVTQSDGMHDDFHSFRAFSLASLPGGNGKGKSKSFGNTYAANTSRRSVLLSSAFPGKTRRGPTTTTTAFKTQSMEKCDADLEHLLQQAGSDMDEEEVRALILGRAKTVKRLDPKAIFASERTYLHYTQKTILLFSVGVLVMNDAPLAIERIIGAAQVVASLLGILVSYQVHKGRLATIIDSRVGHQKSRFDSEKLASLLFLFLSLSVLILLAMNAATVLAFVRK